jgi:signal transduction histidine kinase
MLNNSLELIRRLFRHLLEPRTTDRDEAFRERVVRTISTLLVILGVASLILVVLSYGQTWELESFAVVHILAVALCVASFVLVQTGHRLASGVVLVLAPLFGASGIVLVARSVGALEGMFFGYATFAIAPLIAALVLPRGSILIVASSAALLYGVTQFVVPAGNGSPIDVTPVPMFFTVFLIFIIEGLLLRQLRVEFDSRFAVLNDALKQTELAKEEAEAARLHAEKADRAKSQFLANMSHELRTPLNAIIGYDEAMLAGMAGTFSEKQIDLLKQIQRNGRRLLNLINDVLDLAKVESGTLKAAYAPIEPRLLIPDIIASVKSLADDRGIPITVDFGDDVPDYVVSDAAKLEQILVNLLSNAIKFTDQGSISVDVALEGSGLWSIQVRDSGIGISSDVIPQIFEPFQQADGSLARRHKGTGLGLAITRRLVECIAGEILVESAVGEGTQVTVRLPLAPLAHRTTTRTVKSASHELPGAST